MEEYYISPPPPRGGPPPDPCEMDESGWAHGGGNYGDEEMYYPEVAQTLGLGKGALLAWEGQRAAFQHDSLGKERRQEGVLNKGRPMANTRARARASSPGSATIVVSGGTPNIVLPPKNQKESTQEWAPKGKGWEKPSPVTHTVVEAAEVDRQGL